MATPDWTSGIVEAMAKALDPSAWVHSTYEELNVRLANRREVALTKAQSALAAALPMIGELIANDLEKLLIKQELLLRAGEMGAQEVRSCIAVLKYTFVRIRALTSGFEKETK